MVFRAQRRFIAGTVCVKCAAMDKMVVFYENDKSVCECISCGYRQEMQFSSALKQPPTRLDIVEEKTKSEAEQEVVRILMPEHKK